MTSEKFLIGSVFANGVYGKETARIHCVNDVRSLLQRWTARYGPHLPVIAFRTDPSALLDALHILRLPKTASTKWVAVNLHRAPIQQDVQPLVLRHVRRLGPDATALFQEWRIAVGDALASAD